MHKGNKKGKTDGEINKKTHLSHQKGPNQSIKSRINIEALFNDFLA